MTEKVIGYIRVSTLTQAKTGHSLDFQKEAIEKYCEYEKLELAKPLYIDEGLSAIKDKPKFNEMIKRIFSDDEIKGVIVNDLTRFGRTTEELLLQIKQLDSKGKRFISVKEKIDISTKTGRLLLGILSLIADFERTTITERMQEGKEYAKLHGTKSGKPMNRPKKEIDWAQVKDFREAKISWTKIAKLIKVSTPTLINRAKEEDIMNG
jgi:DNA invertase Pin-like site-specific DNA recombinase